MVATHSSGRIDGAAIPQLAPELVQAVRKKRLVAKVLQDDTWIRDISLSALAQYAQHWIKLSHVHLDTSYPQRTKPFFHGQCGVPGTAILRKTREPPTCKFFI
jgi:hypothetical protein